MSTAEYTAHSIYERYNLSALPQEEERNNYCSEDIEELRTGATEAMNEIKAGFAQPIENFFEEVEAKHLT